MWVSVKDQQKPVKINTEQIALIYPETCTLLLTSGNWLKLSDVDYNELESKMFPKRKKYTKDDSELAEFLNELHRLTGGKNDAVLTPQRNKKLTELLKSFSKDQLSTAAYYIGKDKFLQGENDNHKRYGDIDYLLRPDKAARWAEYKPADTQKKLF